MDSKDVTPVLDSKDEHPWQHAAAVETSPDATSDAGQAAPFRYEPDILLVEHREGR